MFYNVEKAALVKLLAINKLEQALKNEQISDSTEPIN